MAKIISLRDDDDSSLYPVTRTAAVYDSGNQTLDAVLSQKEDKHSAVLITLSASSWSNKSQTVSINHVTTDSTVFVSPTRDSSVEYANSGVYCASQDDKSLTFVCDTIPTTPLVVAIVVF